MKKLLLGLLATATFAYASPNFVPVNCQTGQVCRGISIVNNTSTAAQITLCPSCSADFAPTLPSTLAANGVFLAVWRVPFSGGSGSSSLQLSNGNINCNYIFTYSPNTQQVIIQNVSPVAAYCKVNNNTNEPVANIIIGS